MCAAEVSSLLSKNFTLCLSSGFNHVLVAPNNVEICVISRSVLLFIRFYEGSQSEYIGRKPC